MSVAVGGIMVSPTVGARTRVNRGAHTVAGEAVVAFAAKRKAVVREVRSVKRNIGLAR